MATIPGMAHQRRKKPATYGKSSRNGDDWDVTRFNALEEHGRPKPKDSPASGTRPSRDIDAVVQQERLHNLKSPKARGKKEHDIWELPSSDDDAISPIRVTSPPRFRARSKSIQDMKEPEPKLAPWEEKQSMRRPDSKSQSQANRRRQLFPGSDERARIEPSHEAPEQNGANRISKVSNSRAPKPQTNQAPAGPPKLSAAARLHAKRSQGTLSAMPIADDPSDTSLDTQAQMDLLTDDTRSRPRKRVRGARQVHMNGSSERDRSDTDLHDVSMSDADTHAAQTARPAGHSVTKAGPNRANLTPRWTSRKAELGDPKMLGDSDNPEVTSRTPSTPESVHVTPPPSFDTHSAPQPMDTHGPGSSGETQGTMTPKQANLWKQILPVENIDPSPGMLGMEKLNLQSSRRTPHLTSTMLNFTSESQKSLVRQHAKLVDRLRASAPGSDEETSGQSEAESEQSAQSETKPDDHEEPAMSQQSQNQSQPTRADGGPKITYARDRSYLREESFEEGLMFGLSEETPQKPTSATSGRNNSKQASQKSGFDLDESDDEGGSGRMRTVHELRAGGGNQRFMDDIGGLLDDIADHNISARSRRRTALMDITTKLTDRAYAERFLRQGYEQSLVSECGSTPDEIADFTTTAAFVTLMSNDLPEHAIQALQDGEYLQFLVRLLSIRTDVRRLARDRRYNMSKSAQLSFIGFVDMLAEQQLLWGDSKPTHVTPRLMALKSMEQVVQKLRRLGHRTELMATSSIAQIWPPQGEQGPETLSVEDKLVVSVLESLSTSTHPLAWPSELVQRLGKLLTTLTSAGEGARPTLFLALRLCLNLTNGNVRNCRALSARPTVVSLLQGVRNGFAELDTTGSGNEQRALRLDILLLSMGILMNLAEHDDHAGEYASEPGEAAILDGLVAVCQQGQRRAVEAASEEESAFNVAYGYLAVTLAQLCRYARAKGVIASRLPGGRLEVLVAAVEEFVEYHKDVDRLSSEGGEGVDVWSAFTEKLEGVLARLKAEAGPASA